MSRPPRPVIDIQPLQNFLSLSLTTGYGQAAATTLLLWDIMITLPREKLYIWSYHSRVNWTTLFYIVTRYLPFIVSSLLHAFNVTIAMDSDATTMRAFFRSLTLFYAIPWFVVLGCTEILFIRRIVALHGGSKLLLRILTGLFICELISALVVFFHFTIVNELVVPVTVFLGDRFIGIVGTFLFFSETYFALPELIFQAFLVMLIMKKVILDWKSGTARSNLGSTLIRDGLWSYFFNLCGLLVIVIQPGWLGGPFGLPNLLWSYVSFSVTSSRLVLNIRAVAADRPGATSTSNDASTGTRARLMFTQNIKSFFASTSDELSTPYHYHDLGHDSDSDIDD